MNLFAEVARRCHNVSKTYGHQRRELAIRLSEWGMPDHPHAVRLMSKKSKWRRFALKSLKARKSEAKKKTWAQQRRENIYKFNKALGYPGGIVEWEF